MNDIVDSAEKAEQLGNPQQRVVMWPASMSDRDKKRILAVMVSEGISGGLEEYANAEDLLCELVWEMCI